MQRLSSQDSVFVSGEASGWPLHMGSVVLLDPSRLPDGLDVTRVRALMAARLPQLSVFRRTLVRVPAGLDRPAWTESAEIDLEEHIRAARVPSPGGPRELADLVAELYTPPLDLSRPLWQIWVIEGVQGDRVAMLIKLHHSLVDGVRGREIQQIMYDVTPDAPFVRDGDSEPADGSDSSRWRMLAGSAGTLLATPVRLARTVRHLAGAVTRIGDASVHHQLSGLSMPLTAPRTAFNAPISARRGFSYGTVPLGPIKRMARAESATVNEVVLLLLGGALRRYLAERDDLPAKTLIAAVPIGVEGQTQTGAATGNAWEAMITSLATDVDDPVERLHAITRSSRAGKNAQSALGHDLWADLLDLPPVLVGLAARGYAGLHLARVHPTVVNLIVSNVRGAPMPLYFAGARLEALYPMGPIADGMGLNVTLLSYRDGLDFGFTTCPDLVPDPWLLVEALQAEAAELSERYPAASGSVV